MTYETLAVGSLFCPHGQPDVAYRKGEYVSHRVAVETEGSWQAVPPGEERQFPGYAGVWPLDGVAVPPWDGECKVEVVEWVGF